MSVKSMVIQTNRISLTLQDTDAMKHIGVSVPGTKDGGVFRVNAGVTMEGSVQSETGSGTSVYTEAEAKQLNIEGAMVSDSGQMSPADFISQCMTGEDAQALSDEETPLEEYTSSQLERAIHRIKEQRREQSDSVEHQVEMEREDAQVIEDAALAAVAEQQVSSRILEQMQQSNLPVTSENVMRLSHAIQMTSEISSFTEASMKFFIDQDLTITPENIQGSVYSSQGAEGEIADPDKSDFEEIEDQVRELLTENGQEMQEDKLHTAKWLYDNHLPVTIEKIQLCEQLEELKGLDEDVLSARIIDNMVDGVSPEKANLTKLSVVEAITVKRQLEETRLTMSIEAIRTMSAKGIDLDISNLEKLVDELREQEKQAKASLLEETSLPVTEKNRNLLGDTIQAAKQVLDAPLPFLGKMMVEQEPDTLQSFSEKAIVYTEDFTKVVHHYESVGTEVRQDLGDSMKKAFQNVDDILEDLSFELTSQNRRAVRSLAHNQMPLTEENIIQMKEYDSRVTSLMKDLKPPVVSELIKRNINPLEISLDELTERVKEIQEEIGVEDISFSKYLWKLDHQNGITPEERETMIGVFRLLNKVERSDGAVVGQLLKHNRELSFQSLLSAVRTRRMAGMDVQVDDDFGGLDDVVASGKSISEQIQMAYPSHVAKELQKSISPSVLREHPEEMSLEQLLELCQQEDFEEVEYYEQLARECQEIMSENQERVQQFLSDLELPDTIANIQCVQEFMKQGSREIGKIWEPEDSDEILDAFDEPEQLEEAYADVEEKQKNRLSDIREKDDIKYEDIRNVSRMNQRISFYGNLRNYQMYEIPIFTEQGVTTCNVTVRSQAEDKKGMVEIAMESPEFGKLQASFRVSGNRVKGFVTVAQQESIAICKHRMDEFEKDLEEKGYTMDSGNLIAGSRDSLPLGDKAVGAKNQDLYRIAKRFIVSMSRKDDVV